MPANARLGDKVKIHCPHGGIGTIVEGSPNVFTNEQRQARKGDKVVCDKCGQTHVITSGSPNVSVNSIELARVNDTTHGTCNPGEDCCPHSVDGAIITGSPNTYTN